MNTDHCTTMSSIRATIAAKRAARLTSEASLQPYQREAKRQNSRQQSDCSISQTVEHPARQTGVAFDAAMAASSAGYRAELQQAAAREAALAASHAAKRAARLTSEASLQPYQREAKRQNSRQQSDCSISQTVEHPARQTGVAFDAAMAASSAGYRAELQQAAAREAALAASHAAELETVVAREAALIASHAAELQEVKRKEAEMIANHAAELQGAVAREAANAISHAAELEKVVAREAEEHLSHAAELEKAEVRIEELAVSQATHLKQAEARHIAALDKLRQSLEGKLTAAAALPTASTELPTMLPLLRCADAGATPARLAAMRVQRDRFNALLIRQLLAKYSLLAKTREIAEFVGRRREKGSTPVALASKLGTSLEDAVALALFFGAEMDDAATDGFSRHLLKLPDAAVEATDVVHLRGFLSPDEIQCVFAAASKLSRKDGKSALLPTRANGAGAAAVAHDVQYGGSHVALNLHRDGFFAATCPALCGKITASMRSQPGMYLSPQVALHVRCVEFHTYTAGDGLSTAGHRDQGSVYTMSILLVEPTTFSGGTFMTYASGISSIEGDMAAGSSVTGPWKQDEHGFMLHEVCLGDAILFHSEKMHNVAPVTSGVRHALVCELWLQPTNRTDRFK